MGSFNISLCHRRGGEDRGRGERVNLAVTVFSLLMNDAPPPHPGFFSTSKRFWLCYYVNLEYSSRVFFTVRVENLLELRDDLALMHLHFEARILPG